MKFRLQDEPVAVCHVQPPPDALGGPAARALSKITGQATGKVYKICKAWALNIVVARIIYIVA